MKWLQVCEKVRRCDFAAPTVSSGHFLNSKKGKYGPHDCSCKFEPKNIFLTIFSYLRHPKILLFTQNNIYYYVGKDSSSETRVKKTPILLHRCSKHNCSPR